MEKDNHWNDIIREEISIMLDRLKTRGVDADQFEVNIKASSIEKTPLDTADFNFFKNELGTCFNKENKKEGVVFEVDDLDEIIPQLNSRSEQKVKCSRCGKELKGVKPGDIIDNCFPICKECFEVLKKDVYDFDEESKEDKIVDFIEDYLLDYAIFDDKEDMINFLKDVIEYIKTNDIDI